MVEGLLGWEGERRGYLELIFSCRVAIRRLVRDMLPVSKCMENISIPRALLGQALRTAPQACRKDRQECLSSSRASSSRVCMVSRWACHSLEVCATLAASASLTAVAWVACASHGSCMVGLYPIDGFGGLGFILAMSNLRLRYQPSPMGIY